MRLGGRLSAAIEVLTAVGERHRPVAGALQDWGRANRFAGSADRAAIGNLVYDALRCKRSLAHRMGDDSPRAVILAAAASWGLGPDELAEACADPHGPGALSPVERDRLAAPPADMPPAVAGNYPDWLGASFERTFGARAAEEGAGLAARAPVDLRVNTLKADRAKVLAALKKFEATEAPLAPHGIRIPASEAAGRTPNVEAEPAHGRGWFEVQDAGSQAAAALAGAQPGMQVADICAGGGGKTLALAAAMDNKGQIHAWDADRHRLRPIFERLKRAGVRNLQVVPADKPETLDAMAGRFDVVLVDAPCSGAGSWRRKPDAKWRLTLETLENRQADQRAVLDHAARLVRPGGRIVYITCSVLPEENTYQVAGFLSRHDGFALADIRQVWRAAIGGEAPASADGAEMTLLLTPASHGTDGFFVAVLERTPA